MIKTKLAIYIDTLFISLLSFFLLFVWTRRKIKSTALCLALCITISAIVFFLILKISLKSHNLDSIKSSDLKLAEKSFSALEYSSKKTSDEYFEKLLNSKLIKGKIFKSKNCYYYVSVKQNLDIGDFIDANEFFLETDKSIPLCFLCKNCSENFMNLINGSKEKYLVFSSSELFLLMKEKNFYPVADEPAKRNSIKVNMKAKGKKFLSNLTRSHFKDFFLSGLSLIIFSIFIPYSAHYIVFGSILMLLSIVSLFFKSTNQNKQKNSLVQFAKNPKLFK